MRTVLCYGDSNTWGYVPGSGARHPPEVRWPGVLQARLGAGWRVIEEGLNGRTTVWEEPFRAGRNGRALLVPLLESHAPLDVLVLFLGTNDLKRYYGADAADAARGAGVLVDLARASGCGPGGRAPAVLLVSPPRIGPLSAEMALQLAGAERRSERFSEHYRAEAAARDCPLLDAAEYVEPSPADGVHLDAEAHARLGAAIADVAPALI